MTSDENKYVKEICVCTCVCMRTYFDLCWKESKQRVSMSNLT